MTTTLLTWAIIAQLAIISIQLARIIQRLDLFYRRLS